MAKRTQLLTAIVALIVIAQSAQVADAHGGVRWSIGLNFGVPAYYHRPYYGYGWAPYYAPAPIYYEPAPVVVVRPAPVVVRSEPQVTYSPPPVITDVPPPPPAPIVRAVSQTTSPAADGLLAKLGDAKETVRRDAAMDLGRMRSQQAVDALMNLLAKDSSPIVRDAAAR